MQAQNKLKEIRIENKVPDPQSHNKAGVKDFTDLIAWQIAHKIRLKAYEISKELPETEKYNLISQLQRSSASIAANIAEGYGRYSYQENSQFCRQARGSLDETRDHLIFITELYSKQGEKASELIETCKECRKVLNGYIKYLQENKTK